MIHFVHLALQLAEDFEDDERMSMEAETGDKDFGRMSFRTLRSCTLYGDKTQGIDPFHLYT